MEIAGRARTLRYRISYKKLLQVFSLFPRASEKRLNSNLCGMTQRTSYSDENLQTRIRLAQVECFIIISCKPISALKTFHIKKRIGKLRVGTYCCECHFQDPMTQYCLRYRGPRTCKQCAYTERGPCFRCERIPRSGGNLTSPRSSKRLSYLLISRGHETKIRRRVKWQAATTSKASTKEIKNIKIYGQTSPLLDLSAFTCGTIVTITFN